MEWKQIPGYGDKYKINENGEVWSNYKQGLMKLQETKDGYLRVHLCDGYKAVHRIVCKLWHGEPSDPALQVNHIDGNKKNNNYKNLEWATPSENVKHTYDCLGRSKEVPWLVGNKFNSQKTILKSDTEELEFIDKEAASAFRGRAKNYISNRLYRNQNTAIGSDGRNWQIII